EEAWEKYWTAINYTITIQRVWLGGEQVWQRRTLCYPANPEGFSLYEDECNNDFVSDSNYVTPRFTKIVER
ncbi:MAG: hypothetical protein LBH06_10045, partial [Rikenellaceae bacterium]|nr:hypothetical protein [Rikenellaceae bacterium]